MPHGSKGHDESVLAGIAHVSAHLERLTDDTETDLRYIDSDGGDPEACKVDRRRHAECASLIDWFVEHRLDRFKQWSYVAGKIDRMIYQRNPDRGKWGALGERKAMLWPLLSDHPQLIEWFGAFDAVDTKRATKTGSFEFETYQAKLALRGDWDKLGERSERFLASVPERMERFAPDSRFHLALARGDVFGVESALAEMVTPDQVRWRNEQEGYTGWFIVVEAVICAKIAWRHGFEVNVDTPWIPIEWLPIAPLPRYDDPYDFMRSFDIDTPMIGTSRPINQ